MHCSCIRTFLFPYLVLFVDGVFLFVSLSLSPSRIIYTWHPSANPLHLKTHFVPGNLPLILLLFTFGSMMRRPIRTSRRTSPNVAFIRNVAWFYQTFSILLYPLSFTVRDENLYVRYLWVIPPWSYRSSTPICTISIPLYLGFLRRFEVHISQSLWILFPRYYMFYKRRILINPLIHVWGICLRTNFYLFSVRHLLHGVSAKTPHAWALQKVEGS